MRDCNINIEALIKVADELLALSYKGDMNRDDESCGVLYGLARDYAYRLKVEAEKEREKHLVSGKWI